MTKGINHYRTDLFGFFNWHKDKFDSQLEAQYTQYLEEVKGLTLDEDRLINVVCDKYGINRDLLFSKSRKRPLTDARCIVYVVLRLKYSFKMIGMMCGGRDHSSVLIACNRFDDHYIIENEFKSMADNIFLELGLNYANHKVMNIKKTYS